jgi:hypothetical protein
MESQDTQYSSVTEAFNKLEEEINGKASKDEVLELAQKVDVIYRCPDFKLSDPPTIEEAQEINNMEDGTLYTINGSNSIMIFRRQNDAPSASTHQASTMRTLNVASDASTQQDFTTRVSNFPGVSSVYKPPGWKPNAPSVSSLPIHTPTTTLGYTDLNAPFTIRLKSPTGWPNVSIRVNPFYTIDLVRSLFMIELGCSKISDLKFLDKPLDTGKRVLYYGLKEGSVLTGRPIK